MSLQWQYLQEETLTRGFNETPPVTDKLDIVEDQQFLAGTSLNPNLKAQIQQLHHFLYPKLDSDLIAKISSFRNYLLLGMSGF